MPRALVASCLLGLAIAGCGLLIGSDPEGSGGGSSPLADGGGSDGGPGGPVIACKTPADCPAASSACVLPACTDDGRCAEIATGSSAPLPPAYQQEAGFCIEQYCDRGNVRTRDKPSCGMGGTCKAGACTVPASCTGAEGAGNDCGSALESCCASIEVPGGPYLRRHNGIAPYDNPTFPATVSAFRLDKFEVTVGRLRAFFAAGAGAIKAPLPGQGAHPKIADSGWLAAWQPLLGPAPSQQNDKRFPAKANWYVAFAFCVFDGGRLPTEAEWGYAASGGDEQRVYPWSFPPSAITVGPDQAIQNTTARVGVATGVGRWGHFDLAGNAAEWVLDQKNDLSSIRTCNDCAFLKPSESRSIWKSGGGSDLGGGRGGGDLRIAGSSDEARNYDNVGFRCARDM
jgi:formylglycine-generating enzyme